jgi:hypothetical protein
MERRRRRTCNPPLQLELGLTSIPISPSSPPPWTALPEPTQRTLTELLARLLVSHAGELVVAPGGSDADER